MIYIKAEDDKPKLKTGDVVKFVDNFIRIKNTTAGNSHIMDQKERFTVVGIKRNGSVNLARSNGKKIWQGFHRDYLILVNE